jgi:hypothetical protein
LTIPTYKRIIYVLMGVQLPEEPQRCPTCRTKIVVPSERGLVVHNAILRVSGETGSTSAKCPRCKAWVEVPLTYRA